MNRIPLSCLALEIFRGWEIIEPINAGGHGVVYQVRNAETGENAALKWIHIEKSEGRVTDDAFLHMKNRLINEINILKSLSGRPEIVSIQDSVWQSSPDGQSLDGFIRMELLTPLVSSLQNQEITVGQARTLLQDIARALEICHEHGVIHGDVKPENILRGSNHFKLSDFGVSVIRRMCGNSPSAGTPHFQPPECAKNVPVTSSGDIYALGMTMYVLFNNGLLPYQKRLGRKAMDAAWKKRIETASKPVRILPKPEYAVDALADVILRAISFDPDDRFQSVHDFVRAFEQAIIRLPISEITAKLPFLRITEMEEEEEEEPAAEKSSVSAKTPDSSVPAPSTGIPTPSVGIPTPDIAISEASETQPEPEKVFESELPIEETDGKNKKQDVPSDLPKDDKKEKNSVKETIKKQTRRKKKPKVFFIVAAAVLIVALSVFAAVFLLRPSFTIEAQSEPTSVQISVSPAEKIRSLSAVLYAGDAAFNPIAGQISENTALFEGLVPNTEYTVCVTINGKTQTAEAKTAPAADGFFTPVYQRVYTTLPYLLNEHSLEELFFANRITEITGSKLPIRDLSLSDQGLAVILYIASQTNISSINQESEMIVAMHTPDGSVYSVCDVRSPFAFGDSNFRVLYNVSSLFDAYFADHGEMVSGAVRLEMYLLNELLGSIDILVEPGIH